MLAEQLRATLFLHHPYRNPNIGWENEIRLLGSADALAFYHSWYAPNNAILVVAGDVGTAEVRSLAEQYFGPIPLQLLPPRLRVEEPRHHAATRLEMKSARGAAALEPFLPRAELPSRRNNACLSVAGPRRDPRRWRQLAAI